MTTITAWHIGGLRLGYSDKRPIVYGQWMTADGPPVLFRSGFHASVDILDALKNSTGPIIRRVEVRGDIVTGPGKLAAWNRRHLWRVKDSDGLLRAFARWAALQVADRWVCPHIVRRWLETGEESLRDAARDAAESAAWSAARSAQRAKLLEMIEAAEKVTTDEEPTT